MISDVLSEATSEIAEYLHDETYDDVYEGEIRERLIQLIGDMEMLRQLLDAPPKVES